MSRELPDMTDDELLQKMTLDSEEAFLRLYNTYFKNVYYTACQYLRPGDAHDVCQEIFLSLWKRRRELGHVQNLKAYIVSMTQHYLYNQFRKAQIEQRSRLEFLNRLDNTVNPERDMRLKEYHELVKGFVEMLPPKQRAVYELAREKGMSHAHIARELNTTRDAVEKNMVRALAFIRKQMAPHLVQLCLVLFGLKG